MKKNPADTVPGKLPQVELSPEQLLDKIAMLQGKLKEVLAKKNRLISALSIEKLHNRQFEESIAALKRENSRLKGSQPEDQAQIPSQVGNPDPGPARSQLSEVSSESFEFLDLELGEDRSRFLQSVACQIDREPASRRPEYDVRIKCNSVRDFETASCVVKSRLDEQSLAAKGRQKGVMVAAFGGPRVGKSHILGRVCGHEYPVDYPEDCKSQCLTLKYPQAGSEIGFLDLCGRHLSLNELSLAEKLSRVEDRVLAGLLLEDFLLEACDVMILVVSELRFEDEALLERMRQRFQGRKKVFLVHNFRGIAEPEAIEKRMTVDIRPENRVMSWLRHVIYAREFTPAAEKFNRKGVESLRKAILEGQRLREFDLVKEFREYFKRSAERLQFPRGAELEERAFGKKRVLELAGKRGKVSALPRMDLFGNVVDRIRSPFFRVLQTGENNVKVSVDLPGVSGYKISLVHGEEDAETLVFQLKTAIFKFCQSSESDRETEEFEFQLRVPIGDSTLKSRSQIQGHKLEDGVLEIDVELF